MLSNKTRDMFFKPVTSYIYLVIGVDIANMQIRWLNQGLSMYSVKCQIMNAPGLVVGKIMSNVNHETR